MSRILACLAVTVALAGAAVAHPAPATGGDFVKQFYAEQQLHVGG